MTTCGGCGRDISTAGVDAGNKYLCADCYHLQNAGWEPTWRRNYRSYTFLVAAFLVAMALAGVAMCILYLTGTGRFAWFLILLFFMFCALACPFLVLQKRRNLSLLITSFYLPVGTWFFLYYLAPGVGWEYSRSTAWGALCFLGIGLLSLYLFLRDMRTLPRL